jgi:phosphoribosylaminoimidazole-succinocarboxamide synthase
MKSVRFAENFDVDDLTMEDFKTLPLVIEGESKEVRYLGKGLVIIRFKPTIYSFTENRCAEVPGSQTLRLEASKIFLDVLQRARIRHAYHQVGQEFVLADLVLPGLTEFQNYGIKPFVPPDLTEAEIAALPKGPPIEIVTKRYLTGTTKHSCIGLAGSRVRDSHPYYGGMPLEGDGALPEMLVRFDWRNPLKREEAGHKMTNQLLYDINTVDPRLEKRILDYGSRIADEVLPPQIADLFIDVKKARQTAFLMSLALEDFLASKNIVFYDMCFFIDESGTLVYGELSQDCGRYRHLDLGSLDKDVWRSGGSSSAVLDKWRLLVDLLKGDAK